MDFVRTKSASVYGIPAKLSFEMETCDQLYIYILYIYIGYPIFRETAFMIHQNNAIVQGCMIILNCHFCDCVTFSCRHRCYMI